MPEKKSIISAKKQLRSLMAARRDSLQPAELAGAAQSVADTLADFLKIHFTAGQKLNLALYRAVGSELDLTGVFELLPGWPMQIYFPSVATKELLFAPLPSGVQPEQFLHPGVFGIPEPPLMALQKDLPPLDLILVPGLAFDCRGGRLGWGKAYYDRFLSAAEVGLRVGACHECQIVDQVPLDRHDIRMDYLLTPKRWLKTCT